ncbi:MAG: DUF192 domain-containing protein [Deltaproteobacteria bacterium]|nr:DUF192 domain-containing protein [Deltaproteobacteria bacterium]
MPSWLKKREKNSLLLFLPILLLVHCSNRAEEVEVLFQSPQGLNFYQLEVAKTGQQRAQGLMFREKLPSRAGMLFVFPQKTASPFWMKNTPLSLDILFINERGVIVDLIERATPFSEELLIPKEPYAYVIEIRGGSSLALGVRVGGQVRLPEACYQRIAPCDPS